MYLYHYYERTGLPFANLSDLPVNEANDILNKIKRDKPNSQHAKRQEKYVDYRRNCESILRSRFIEKGGIIKRNVPHYMTIEHSPWLSTWFENCAFIKIPIEEFDIKTLSFKEGGSTITEQLSKNMYFTQEKDLKRKVAEVFVTLDLEKNYTKNEILELYLNTSYFGNGYYTVSEASKGYFNKDAKDMTDSEATLLAGIPNAPSVYNPKENLKLAKERQKQVLDKMVQYKKITKEKEDEILSKE